MKTLFLSAGPIQWGSSRFRCYWPAEHMDADVQNFQEGIDLDDINKYDAYIFQKYTDIDTMKMLLAAGKQVWLDHCDPMWWWSSDAVKETIGHSTGAVFSNESLRQDFRKWLGSKTYPTWTIPDRMKPEHYSKKRKHEKTDPVKFIWFGASMNRMSLFGAWTNLSRLVANGYNITLTVMDDRPDAQLSFGNELPVHHAGFSLEQENNILSSHDIALLPPYPGPWGKVKSENKRVTACLNGLPFLSGFDYEHLVMYLNPVARQSYVDSLGNQEEAWDVKKSAQDWKDILDV